MFARVLVVAPSRVRELKPFLQQLFFLFRVAPSRVRELKLEQNEYCPDADLGRTFTGA